jgi:putative ABC transport system permease protein
MVWVFAGFGGSALALVAIGVYGLLAYSLAQRRHEMAIRLALGAARREILSLMLGQSMKYVAAGLAGGLLASLVLARMMTKFLYRVTPTDPATYLVVALVVVAVAAAAGYVPSRRAADQDPNVALRIE